MTVTIEIKNAYWKFKKGEVIGLDARMVRAIRALRKKGTTLVALGIAESDAAEREFLRATVFYNECEVLENWRQGRWEEGATFRKRIQVIQAVVDEGFDLGDLGGEKGESLEYWRGRFDIHRFETLKARLLEKPWVKSAWATLLQHAKNSPYLVTDIGALEREVAERMVETACTPEQRMQAVSKAAQLRVEHPLLSVLEVQIILDRFEAALEQCMVEKARSALQDFENAQPEDVDRIAMMKVELGELRELLEFSASSNAAICPDAGARMTGE